MLEELQTYQGGLMENIASLDLPHIRKTRMGIIYNLFRIFGIEHEISPKELKLIHNFGHRLDVTKDQINQIKDLFEEEDKLRQRRAQLLFPKGFDDALVEYQKYNIGKSKFNI